MQIIGRDPGVKRVAGLYMMGRQSEVLFFADPVINIDPTAEEVAEIAVQTANMARAFDVEPRVAMLSFSTFGSSDHPHAQKMRRATELVRATHPDLIVEGEMQADLALQPESLIEAYPFAQLGCRAHVLIFPDLTSATLAYRLLNLVSAAACRRPRPPGPAQVDLSYGRRGPRARRGGPRPPPRGCGPDRGRTSFHRRRRPHAPGPRGPAVAARRRFRRLGILVDHSG